MSTENIAKLVKAATVAQYKIEAIGEERLYITAKDYFNHFWNALEDDGDAFRLAADLQFSVEVGALDGTVVVTSNNDNRIYSAERWEAGETSYKATRAAIVNAAVEYWGLRNGH